VFEGLGNQVIDVRYADEDRLVWDAQMTQQAVMLDAVEVQGEVQRLPVRIADRPTPGAVELALSPQQVERLPIELLGAQIGVGTHGVGADRVYADASGQRDARNRCDPRKRRNTMTTPASPKPINGK